MRKTLLMALGAGLLAVAALPSPDPALAGSGSHSLLSRSSSDGTGIVPIASRLSTRRAPTTFIRPPGITPRPAPARPWRPSRGTKIKPGHGTMQPLCQPPKLTSAKKSCMAGPTPDAPLQLCNGKLLKRPCYYKGKVQAYTCLDCGGAPMSAYLACMTCKAGYSWNAATKSCCKGTPSVPIPK